MSDETGSDGRGAVTIVGVGGAGGNAVAGLAQNPGLRVVCANTDSQALAALAGGDRLQLGRRLTGGLGAGAIADTGRLAAEEALPAIARMLDATSLCIVVAGLGGGTGTGAAPVIARLARSLGILTIGIAIMPFRFEGSRRSRVAQAGAVALETAVDALLTVHNQNLFRVAGPETTLASAFHETDGIVRDCATGYAGLLSRRALKRATIGDMRSILCAGGKSVMGYGEHHFGPDRALLAARSALRNPLLENIADGAHRLLVTVSGGDDLRLFEVDQAIAHLRSVVHADAEIVWGANSDAALAGGVRVGIAATGLADAADTPCVLTSRRTPLAAATTIAETTDAPGENARFATPDRNPAVIAAVANDVRFAHDARERSAGTGQHGRIRARTGLPSLADRTYFAMRDAARRWRRILRAANADERTIETPLGPRGATVGARIRVLSNPSKLAVARR